MKTVLERRLRRKLRIKRRLASNINTPQVIVFKSNKYTYAQVYDPKSQKVLFGLSSKTVLKNSQTLLPKTQAAFETGKRLAEWLLQKGLSKVVFNRNGFKYHGRVKAVCEGLRASGIAV